MIANSGHDENGKYSGGKAGDQTGTEWQVQPWYDRPWTNVFRYPIKDIREVIASLAEEAAANNKIGYDQGQRTTFWRELEKVGYHPKDITVACEADCSAGVAAILKAAGYLTGDKDLQDISVDMYTGSETMELVDAGFINLTDKMYLTSDKYLMRGDVLLCRGHHTAINLTNGVAITDPSWHWVLSDGIWYYQNNLGQNAHGWHLIKETKGTAKHWYYFNDKGQMVTGCQWINGQLCLFMPDPDNGLYGAMCTSDSEGYQHVWYV